jgi:hypothetical protein
MICQDIEILKGRESKHFKDCQVRAVRGKSFAEAAALLGWTEPPPIVIHAGIGTLVLDETSETFTPAPTTAQKAKSWIASLTDRTAATPEQLEQRGSICASCNWMDPKRSVCTACGCGIKAKTALASQKCPKGMW